MIDLVGRSLADGAGMFWETLWALVLGFGLSGVVQAFVSRAQMQRSLGDHRAGTIAKAGFFGMVSSSCSYAASALAKTLFARGADFTAAQSFMFASTNLVLELGIVLWLLIGWEFAAAEFVGGAVMIVLLAAVLPRVVSSREQQAARASLQDGAADHHHEHYDGSDRPRVSTLAGWADAAAYTVSDLTMLRREIVIGFVVAGFADAAVPVHVWKSLFVTGHGFWSALENVVLGPFLALISFVCSIGNVPLAAALWTGGISFGGTIAFVFGDLIALPLLLIYRKYYGARLTAKLLAVFWACMSVAGLVTEYVFRAAGVAPHPDSQRHGHVGRDVWGWNYTTVLDIIALLALAAIYLLYRSRARLGGGAAYAKDPICGMQVEKANPGAVLDPGGARVYFCSDHCKERYLKDGAVRDDEHTAGATHAKDPICGMQVDKANPGAVLGADGERVYFCCDGCRGKYVDAKDLLTQQRLFT